MSIIVTLADIDRAVIDAPRSRRRSSGADWRRQVGL